MSQKTVKPINVSRIVWHAAGGIAIVLYMLRTHPAKAVPLVALSIATVALLIGDILRFTTDWGESFFKRHFRFIASDKERKGPNTSFYFVVSLLFSILIFSPRIAMGAIVCLSVGDPVAGIVGRLAGRIRIRSKSLEGALANAAACYCINRFIVPSDSVALAGALAGSVAELVQIPKVDDNVVIPLVSGLAMTIAHSIS